MPAFPVISGFMSDNFCNTIDTRFSMASPASVPVQGGGTSRVTYAAPVNKPKLGPCLTPVPLTHRAPTYIDHIPGIMFTSLEEEQLCKQHENTLIMKFSAGKPRIFKIREHVAAKWQLETLPAIGYLDPRHVTLHMGSTTDTNRALVRPSNKIKKSVSYG